MPATGAAHDLSGWGRYPVVSGHELRGEDLEQLSNGAALTRGLGRSYGDASLPAARDDTVVASPLADRLLRFDAATGVVRAEAGFPLWRLNRLFLPRGWFTPVTPGTHYVTLGGMVAADVHGKSHHRDGCFGEHVTTLKMRVADGRVLECSDEHERDLFRATLGGMGLTGHILEVEFRMHRIPSPWIWQESERFADFDSLLRCLAGRGKDVADDRVLGRLSGQRRALRARHSHEGALGGARRGAAARPALSARAVAAADLPELAAAALDGGRRSTGSYYHKHGARPHVGIVHPETFFYPLDVIRNWNYAYGKRGFTQYQCVLPAADNHAAPPPFRCGLLQAHRARRLPLRDQGLRCRRQGHAVVPAAGDLVCAGHPRRAADPVHRRRAQRAGAGRGRADLSRQGCVHARRAFSRHGAAPRGVECGAPQVGPARRAAQRPVGARVWRPAMKVVFLGATKGMGRALARLLAQRGDQLFLLGRDLDDLQRSATDLELFGARGHGRHSGLRPARSRRASRRRSTRPPPRWAASIPSSSPPACSPPKKRSKRMRR